MFSAWKLSLYLPFVLWCWLMMMVVHEAGHVLGAVVTGGKVNDVVLYPFTISRTDVSPNPMPAAVCWSGPVLGVMIPIAFWALLAFAKFRFTHLARFFAGFCLIANGAYLAIGSFDAIGDAGELLKQQGQVWQLVLFGCSTIPIGFLLWHGQGAEFGVGESKGNEDASDIYVSIGLFAVTFVTLLLVG